MLGLAIVFFLISIAAFIVGRGSNPARAAAFVALIAGVVLLFLSYSAD